MFNLKLLEVYDEKVKSYEMEYGKLEKDRLEGSDERMVVWDIERGQVFENIVMFRYIHKCFYWFLYLFRIIRDCSYYYYEGWFAVFKNFTFCRQIKLWEVKLGYIYKYMLRMRRFSKGGVSAVFKIK